MTSQLKLLCAAVALASAGPVLGATTWTLNASGTAASGDNNVATATSTGYANTSGSNGVVDSYSLQIQPNSSNTILYGGGIGINNRDGCTGSCGTDRDVGDVASTAPEHAIDNDQRYEMVLVSFTTPVALTSVTSGWTGTDADITVVGYQPGQGMPAIPTLSGSWGASVTVANGWSFLANSQGLAHGINSGTTTATIAGAVYSSYWLIGAFNPLVSTNAGRVVDDGTADYLKLLRVAGCVQGDRTGGCGGTSTSGNIPEPKSSQLALLGVGLLLGTMWMRRRARSR